MMSGFLYFAPSRTRNIDRKDVAALGLSYAFERPPTSRVCHNHTPTGTAGVVFADESRHEDGNVKMEMDAQVWRKISRPGQSESYVGYWKESPPAPGDLKRANQLGGYRLRMADGEEWLCPIVRMFDEASETLHTALPARMDLDENGNPVAGDVVAECAVLYDLMSDYAAHMQAGTIDAFFSSLTMAKLCSDAAQLLQANYVVSLAEISAMGMWHVTGDECRQASTIVLSAVDYGTYCAWESSQQKKTPSLAAVAG